MNDDIYYRASDSAPVIYFDFVAATGVLNGAIQVELGTRHLLPKKDGSVEASNVISARVRCSPTAAVNLLEALTTALQMVQDQAKQSSDPTSGSVN